MKLNIVSTRLAFILIAILFFLVLLSALIPQKDIAFDRIADLQELLGDGYIIIEILKLDEIYTTPYFFILLGLLSINLIAANIKRFKILPDNPMAIRDTQTGINYHTGGAADSKDLHLLLSSLEHNIARLELKVIELEKRCY